MKRKTALQGGNVTMEYTERWLSPLGGITLAGEDACLTGLWFDGQKGQGVDARHTEKHLPQPIHLFCFTLK